MRFFASLLFHEVSQQAQARELFDRTVNHLKLDALYAEVKDRISRASVSTWIPTVQRRQTQHSRSRLTVVTTFGLVGTDRRPALSA